MNAVASQPILAGFHPDPSVCRVGDDFYLITSSFEYLPGVPVYHSRDLNSWTHVGNVLDRPSQMPAAASGGGIYAPTLRYRDGTFWMITTDVTRMERGQLLMSATDPAGPWSDPTFVSGVFGIDPDLAWDADGTCLVTWAAVMDGTSIGQVAIDLGTSELLEEPRTIWRGTGLATTEGPHLYARDGWWYLVVAEGGTERGHVVSVARSRSPRGPFESHPTNPIFTHRSRSDLVQNVGHADLVELADGRWAAVHLGVRPRGVTPGFHVNGRETFLAHVHWDNGWPVLESAEVSPKADNGFQDDFDADLHRRWSGAGTWPDSFATTADGPGLGLFGSSDLALLTRVPYEHWHATLTLASGDAGLLLRIDDHHFVRVIGQGQTISGQLGIIGNVIPLGSMPRPSGPIELTISAAASSGPSFSLNGPDRLILSATTAGGTPHEVGTADGRYVSTEVAGGFTGRMIGPQLIGGCARITRFNLTPDTTATEAAVDDLAPPTSTDWPSS